MFSHKTAHYNEGQEAVSNPFQGFYVQLDSADYERMSELSEENVHLVFIAYNLNGFQPGELSHEKLSELKAALSTADRLGLQVIFRAAYGFAEGTNTQEPQALDTVLLHIGQIAPIINAYKHIILCVQAGMLGPWGEGHSSHFFTDKTAEESARNEVTLAWDQLLAEEIQLQLRTLTYIKSASSAGVPMSRLGFHNDALLSSTDDLGTYRARSDELLWVKNSLSHSKTGGETAGLSRFTDIEYAVKEFNLLGLTYLNLKYNTDVLDLWNTQTYQDENALDYIGKHLGLRLFLSKSVMPRCISSFQNTVILTLTNTGFAHAPGNLYFKIVVRTDDDIQYLEPDNVTINGQEISIKINLSSALSSSYSEIGLWTGYGIPGDSLDFTLANESRYIHDHIMYFSAYNRKILDRNYELS